MGEDGYAQLREFERTTTVRNWVDGWAGGATVYLGEPFTREQGEQLIQAIANANGHYRASESAYGQFDWHAVDASAQQILTPAQYRFFTSSEPPLPNGGRFQSELYQKIQYASTIDSDDSH